MNATYHGHHWTLTASTEVEIVRSGLWTLDAKWRGTDSNGHEHYYDHGYPTLDFIIDAKHWCDGNEGIAHHDPHEQVDQSHYECLICREVVTPGLLAPDTPMPILGSRTATLEGQIAPGRYRRIWLTEDEYEGLVANPTDDAADALLLNAAKDRIIEERFSSP